MNVRRIAGRWVTKLAIRGAVTMTAAGGAVGYHGDYVDLRGQLPRRSDAEYRFRPESDIQGLVWHHTATNGQGWNSVARYHTDAKGWAEIGYHFGVDYRGVKYHLLDVTKWSNHTQGHNRNNISVVMLGNFHARELPDEMKPVLLDMQFDLAERYNLKWSWLHNETKATACPGRYATEFLKPYLFGPRP